MTRLGLRQIELLERFKEPKRFKPRRGGWPWPEMQSLAAKGLLWIECRHRMFWNPNIERFGSRSPETEFWAGATTDGRLALANLARKGGRHA